MLLTARLRVWLLGSLRNDEAPGFWRGFANLLMTGSALEARVEEQPAPQDLISRAAQAISEVAAPEPPTPIEGGWRLQAERQSGELSVAVTAFVSHRHHPLWPAVVVELAVSTDDRSKGREALDTASASLQQLQRGLREKLPVARIDRETRRFLDAREAEADPAFVALAAMQASVAAPAALGADDWGGGAFDTTTAVSDAGGGSLGDPGDGGGGSF